MMSTVILIAKGEGLGLRLYGEDSDSVYAGMQHLENTAALLLCAQELTGEVGAPDDDPFYKPTIQEHPKERAERWADARVLAHYETGWEGFASVSDEPLPYDAARLLQNVVVPRVIWQRCNVRAVEVWDGERGETTIAFERLVGRDAMGVPVWEKASDCAIRAVAISLLWDIARTSIGAAPRQTGAAS